MFWHEKIGSLFGLKKNKMLLNKWKGDYKNHQYYICRKIKIGFIYIQIEVNLLQEMFFMKHKMANQNWYICNDRMPEAAKNYSITELNLFGLAINIASFANLLKTIDFHARVYHLALTHIINSKAEPPTNRIKNIIRSFKIILIQIIICKWKGYDTQWFSVLEKHEKNNSQEIIPTSFNMEDVLHAKYYDIHVTEKEWYFTRSLYINI